MFDIDCSVAVKLGVFSMLMTMDTNKHTSIIKVPVLYTNKNIAYLSNLIPPIRSSPQKNPSLPKPSVGGMQMNSASSVNR